MTIYDIKDPNIAENFKEYTDTIYGNLSYLKYIYTECDFYGSTVDDYLPHQRYELPTNKWEE